VGVFSEHSVYFASSKIMRLSGNVFSFKNWDLSSKTKQPTFDLKVVGLSE